MQFQRLVFPAPNPPSYSQDRLVGELLYVPKDFRECPYKYMKKERGNQRRRNAAKLRNRIPDLKIELPTAYNQLNSTQ